MFLLAGEQRYFEETLPVSELKELLDSGSMSSARGQADRIRGLKWLLAMISKGTDVSRFFPDVIRNIMTVNFELKKLAYMYVLHYCDHDEQSRSTALLSINAFQRDLSDESELIRGLALRTLTSIRVRDILEVQFLAIKTSCRDPSPYVRKICANSVSKLGVKKQFEDSVLGVLIMDPSPSVMGSAAQAMLQVCPDRFDLVHQAFERVCLVLHEVDEFGQVALLKLLSRYVRYAFTCPVLNNAEEFDSDLNFATSTSMTTAQRLHLQHQRDSLVVVSRKLPTKRELDSFLDDDNNEQQRNKSASPSPPVQLPSPPPSTLTTAAALTANHKRLLQLSLSLLKSRNSGVVMAAAHTSWYCGQRSTSALRQVAQALMRLVKSPMREVAYFALQAVAPLVRERPKVFSIEDFFIQESDLWQVKLRKLELIAFLCQDSTLDEVLGELEIYSQNKNQRFAAQAVRTLGEICQAHPNVATECLQGLSQIVFAAVNRFSARVREEAIGVVRQILARGQQDDFVGDFLRIDLDNADVLGSKGKVSLLWLARRFHSICSDESADMLREVAQTFVDEPVEVKLEALALAKCFLQNGNDTTLQVEEVAQYVISLGKVDANVEVRDWARFVQRSKITNVVMESAEEASIVIKPRLTGNNTTEYEIDSLSFVLGSPVRGYQSLPSWSSQPREFAIVTNNATSATFKSKKPPPRLVAPQFFSSSSSSSSEEEEDSSDEESSSSGTSDSSSSEEEEKPAPMKRVVAAPVAAPAVAPAPVAAPALAPAPAPAPAKHLLPVPNEFLPLLSSVRGNGLQLEHCFSRQRAPLGWTCVLLKLTNKHVDTTFSNIRLERTDQVVPQFDSVSALPVGFSREDLQIHVNFLGQWSKAVKLTLCSEETGRISFDLKPPVGELLYIPDDVQLTLDEFQRLQKQLSGMNQVFAKLTQPHPFSMQMVKHAVWRAGNLWLVHEFDSATSSNLLDLDTCECQLRYFALRSDAQSTKVLVELTWQNQEVSILVSCEYALAAQPLMDQILHSLKLEFSL